MRKQIKKRLSAFLVATMLFEMLPLRSFGADGEAQELPGEVSASSDFAEGKDSTPVPEGPIEMESVKQDAYVVSEVEARRTESGKHFRMSDGTFLAVDYGEAIHYQNEPLGFGR